MSMSEDDKHPFGSKIRATFNPLRRDDIRPHMQTLIGKTAIWVCLGVSGDEEPYPGQKRYCLDSDDDPKLAAFWSPECDFSDIEEVK